MAREVSWLSIVQRADPEHARNSRHVIEYEFTAYQGGDDRTHERGMRVFRGNYDVRGPYAPRSNLGLVWNGTELDWGGTYADWNAQAEVSEFVEMTWEGDDLRWGSSGELSWSP